MDAPEGILVILGACALYEFTKNAPGENTSI
ncbi:DUF3937 family protein [Bacillus mycoides]